MLTIPAALGNAARAVAAAAVAMSCTSGLVACDSADDPVRDGGGGVLCSDEVTFRGVRYGASDGRGEPPAGLPANPVRGRLIGEADPQCAEAPKRVDAFKVKGLSAEKAIFVEGYGAMAPVDVAD